MCLANFDAIIIIKAKWFDKNLKIKGMIFYIHLIPQYFSGSSNKRFQLFLASIISLLSSTIFFINHFVQTKAAFAH